MNVVAFFTGLHAGTIPPPSPGKTGVETRKTFFALETIEKHVAHVAFVRKTLGHLRIDDQWKVTDLETAAGLAPGAGRVLIKALQAAGLIESRARGVWTVTHVGCTFSVATAAKPVTRVTAEKALAQFMDKSAASKP